MSSVVFLTVNFLKFLKTVTLRGNRNVKVKW